MTRLTRLAPVALLIVTAALAGCAETTLAPEPPADHCKAAEYQHRLGTPIRLFDAKLTGVPVRILAPGSIMTMDYRSERMNVTHDAKGRITRIYCG